MLFNSYIFILFFLPVTLLFYYLLNHYKKYTMAQIFLIGMSGWFYAYFNPLYLLILCVSILINYYFHWRLSLKRRKYDLFLGVSFNLLLLGWYKYYDFFVENINSVFGTSFVLQHILLPLGISFFTFQQISFLIDTYQEEAEQCGFVEYTLFVVFFPQLIAGPIVTYDEMIGQFRDPVRKKPNPDKMAEGIMLFTFGLAKKVILADTFNGIVDWGYTSVNQLNASSALLISVLYTFQLYFDFSGYCDMAKGIGQMLHIELPVNFDSPYRSAGIIEFWKRWHITLGRFFTKYVYVPLGGSKKGKLRTCLNSFFVFVLSGLWHGANWTYVTLGIMHGFGYMIDFLGRPFWKKLPRPIRIFFTYCFVDLTYVAFRSPNISIMRAMYGRIFNGGLGQPMKEIPLYFVGSFWKYFFQVIPAGSAFVKDYLPFLLYMAVALYLVFIGKNAPKRAAESRFGIVSALGCAVLFLYCVVSLGKVSSFLYFNF